LLPSRRSLYLPARPRSRASALPFLFPMTRKAGAFCAAFPIFHSSHFLFGKLTLGPALEALHLFFQPRWTSPPAHFHQPSCCFAAHFVSFAPPFLWIVLIDVRACWCVSFSLCGVLLVTAVSSNVAEGLLESPPPHSSKEFLERSTNVPRLFFLLCTFCNNLTFLLSAVSALSVFRLLRPVLLISCAGLFFSYCRSLSPFILS